MKVDNMPARKLAKPKSNPKLRPIVRVNAIQVVQGKAAFYLCKMQASQLYKMTEINRRAEGKQEGYQRVLSGGRTKAVSRYIKNGGSIPGAIVVSFDTASFDEDASELIITGDENAGWVIDGQHRLIGAWEASSSGTDIELAVVAFLQAETEDQIELFVTINREAKGVPSSLYLDLLKDLPRRKTDKEQLDERIVDIAKRLNNEETGPFYQRLIFTRTAKAGEISAVNFARILRPIITRQSGVLGLYTEPEQEGAISNYYKSLIGSFPKADEKEIFFRTIGFGAVWRAFPLILNLTQTTYKSFNVASISKILKRIDGFDFEAWNSIGTGSQAEIQAGEDLVSAIESAFSDDTSKTISLKLD